MQAAPPPGETRERFSPQTAVACTKPSPERTTQSESVGGEGVVARAAAVELLEQERFDGFGCQTRPNDRLEVRRDLISSLLERPSYGKSGGGPGSTRWGGVVDDRAEEFAGAVEAECLLHEQPFADVVAGFVLELEGFAEDADGC